jgi:vacuolar-type H+-ATPase subunit I/STV1
MHCSTAGAVHGYHILVLLAVMCSDIGHGFIMAAFSAYVVQNEKRINRRKLGEFMTTVYDWRYVLLLMGLFFYIHRCVV